MKIDYLFFLPALIISNVLFAQKTIKDTIPLEETVVTGTQVQVLRKNVPLTVTSISKEEINQSDESALLPIIGEFVPGLFVTERGVTGFGVATGAAGGITIRGIGGSPNTEVLILIDGNPQFMGIMGHPLPDAYVASDAEKVEVIRGPASILYGSNAMGGVINIITKKQTENGFKSNARMMYGSYNTQKYMISGGYKKGNFDIYASVNHDKTDGHRDSSAFDIVNGYIKANYKINEHYKVNADYSLAKFKSQDPGMEGFFAGEEINIMRGKTAFSVENNYKKVTGALKIYMNYGEHNITDGFHSLDHSSGVMFYQGLKLFKNNTITVGVDYINFGGKAENILAMNGQGIVFGDKTITEIGSYAFLQQTLFQKLIFNAGLRIENNSLYGNEVVPQTGFAYHPTNYTTIKGSVSKGYRSPTIRELYLWAPANEELQPERMMNYEIGMIQQLYANKLNFELTGFISEGNNLIQTVLVNGLPKNMNSGKFNNKGVELASYYNPVKGLHIHLNYSFLALKYPILAAPENQIFFNTRYNFGKLSFSISIKYINNLYVKLADATPEIKEDYTLLNTKITYAVNNNLNLFVSGENITNTEYQINYGYPMPGITFFGGVNFNLMKK
ncbi:MAG: TonB-dependent receptor [Chlorobi bacterium]|nr:TonB-dependent receptor [Chlorobiota bacterium]